MYGATADGNDQQQNGAEYESLLPRRNGHHVSSYSRIARLGLVVVVAIGAIFLIVNILGHKTNTYSSTFASVKRAHSSPLVEDEDHVYLFAGTYTRDEGWVHGKGKGIYTLLFNTVNGTLEVKTVTDVGTNPSFITGTKLNAFVTSEASAEQQNKVSENEDEKIAQETLRLMYAVNEDYQPSKIYENVLTGYAVALFVNPNGSLTILNKLETNGTSPCHVSLSKKNDFLTVANYDSGSVALFPLQPEDGSLAPMSDFFQYIGGSMVVPSRQMGSHMHSVVWVPDSNVSFAADLGNDRVAQFILDSANQKLLPNPDAPFLTRPPGSGPRHTVVHPSKKYAYIVHELDNTVALHEYDETTGTLAPEQTQVLSTIPDTYHGANGAAEIQLSSNGNFLYVSNRGHNSIAAYRIIDIENGLLESIGFTSVEGSFPRMFMVFRNFLIVANQNSDNITVFKINEKTGEVTYTGISASVPNPVTLFIAQN